MAKSSTASKPRRVYRVDKFLVPDASRAEHLEGVHKTHDFLRTQLGFIQDFLIEKRAGPDSYNLMTIVEWDSEESFQAAILSVKAMHSNGGIVREADWKRLGITPELGDYHTVLD